MSIAIKIENLSKQYRLGLVSTKTLSHDLNRWWQTSILGREDPYLKIGETNIRESKGTSEYVWALKDINLEVEEGEVLGIIGKNGAGKSTLLKILSKVTAPTTGIVKARGRIASLLEVGTGFHQEMTGRENIYMNGAIMGMTKKEITSKLDEIVDFAGVERYLDTPVKRYSSGMTVRLGFSVAAHLEPEILVVDEVLAVGDAEFQKKAIGKMHDVSSMEGRTVIFVSHNMGSIKELCTKGIVLKDGHGDFIGNVDDAIHQYLGYNQNSIGGNILESVIYKSKNLIIDALLVNGSINNKIQIDKNNRCINFEISGRISINLKIALEIKIYDKNELPLAFFSPNHYSGKSNFFPSGEFKLNESLILPDSVSKGTYYADIYLTNPMVEYYAEIHKGLIIEEEGYPTKTGFVFEYSKGHGWLFLH